MQAGLASFNQENNSHASLPSKRKTKKEKARISSDQLLEMIAEAETKFIKPKPQPDLDGELGVTLSDIAESLGVAHSDLRRKLERSGEMEFLTILNHKVKTIVFFTADNRAVDSYVLDMMAAQHIVAKYDNLSGRYYLDFLIRCKDALKVSLNEFQRLEADLKRSDNELAKANKKIAKLSQPKISKRPNIKTMKIVPAYNDPFHEGNFQLIPEVVQYPEKGETQYDEKYVQKMSKITKGNIKGIKKALNNMGCSSDVINNCFSLFESFGNDFDGLINPTDAKEYAELKKRVERYFARLES